jgi:hypothetical protein
MQTTTTIKSLETLVAELSCNFSKIIPLHELKKYPELYWGGNGVGDRWAKKRFNYCVVYYNKTVKVYSENEEVIPDGNCIFEDSSILLPPPPQISSSNQGIIGIYIFSKRKTHQHRGINALIRKKISTSPCVSCGSFTDLVCDHKNDLYNDNLALNVHTQTIDDFQSLCRHCNLQKRQVCKDERRNNKLYSAKNMQKYKQFPFPFPWEKMAFDTKDSKCKVGTYWYDPVEFNKKIYLYLTYTIPLLKSIKQLKCNSKLNAE